MPESMRALAQPGVEILGFVPDMEPLLLSSRISIAPLRYGAGVKGKINQAMSYGLPVVATPVAVEGMYLQHGDNVLVAESATEYADAIASLYTDDSLWDSLADGGKANIRQCFSRSVARETLGRLLDL
jgi:glycosyltransferase involved in cell wall biosynthesis